MYTYTVYIIYIFILGQLSKLVEILQQFSFSAWLKRVLHLLHQIQTVVLKLEKSLSAKPFNSYEYRMQVVVQRTLYSSDKLDKSVYLNHEWLRIDYTTDISTSVMLLMDECYVKLVGSSQDSPCIISDSCWQLMSKFHVRGYRLTHEILYFILGYTYGCDNVMKEHVSDSQVSLEHIISVLCSNVFTSAVKKYETGLKTGHDEDLFMEQIIVCSLLGFKNFLKPAWLHYAIRLQNKSSGCFSPSESDQHLHQQSLTKTMRHLFVERKLPNNCFLHMTSLGLAFLSIYLRHLLPTQLYNVTSAKDAVNWVLDFYCVIRMSIT